MTPEGFKQKKKLQHQNIKGLLHGYEWRLRFGAFEFRFG